MTREGGGTGSLKAIPQQEAPVYHLPGRDWFLCVGPENTDSKNLTLGVAEFPAGSNPPGHIHPSQEEVIYILSGSGELVTPDGTLHLEAKTSAYIPVGLLHATVSRGPEPLVLVSVFSPPVVPGSYESPNP
jgi:quercetin dioxygenase-like cupin family protein